MNKMTDGIPNLGNKMVVPTGVTFSSSTYHRKLLPALLDSVPLGHRVASGGLERKGQQ